MDKKIQEVSASIGVWIGFLAVAILGTLAGAIFTVAIMWTLLWLSQFLPLQTPWPTRYWARVDYAIQFVAALVTIGLFNLLRRQGLVFARAFAFAATCIILLDTFFTAIGLDGSWDFP